MDLPSSYTVTFGLLVALLIYCKNHYSLRDHLRPPYVIIYFGCIATSRQRCALCHILSLVYSAIASVDDSRKKVLSVAQFSRECECLAISVSSGIMVKCLWCWTQWESCRRSSHSLSLPNVVFTMRHHHVLRSWTRPIFSSLCKIVIFTKGLKLSCICVLQ